MSLTVEDGTGLSTAESYISVTDASTRMTALGMSTWATLSTAQMEEALRRATQYMLQAYRGRWKGLRFSRTQALDWPRWDVVVDGWSVESDVVPTEVANACADLALKAAADDLNPDLERAIVREKTGPLETEWDRYGRQSTSYRAVDMALAPYLTAGGAMARLIRT